MRIRLGILRPSKVLISRKNSVNGAATAGVRFAFFNFRNLPRSFDRRTFPSLFVVFSCTDVLTHNGPPVTAEAMLTTVNNSNNSTQLIETVSIDYDDFNDTFLTCATCLCVYDGGEHAPKLLSCSHTVCVHCLTRIVSAANNRHTTLETLNNGRNNSSSSSSTNNIMQSQAQRNSQQQQQTFRCPICRELIVVPQNGGVTSLPPSFLVNQLLDLISTHRQRTLIPSCCGGGTSSSHANQELLYCETCDQVFCSVCTKHDSKTVGNNVVSSKSLSSVHTVIPVSIAMKRTSEIMLYKANECVSKLNSSRDEILTELNRLDASRNKCLTVLDETFNDLINILENRKCQLQSHVHKAYDVKNVTLNQQLSAFEIEKTKIMDECGNVNQLIDVQSINQQIQILNDRLQQLPMFDEPRENAFIALDLDITAVKNNVINTVGQMGCVRTSTTCSSLCILHVTTSEEQLVIPRLVDVQIAVLTAVDYDGNKRTLGGDPVTVKLEEAQSNLISTVCNNSQYQQPEMTTSDCIRVIDKKNGQYVIRVRLSICCRYRLYVYILGRPVSCNGITGGHINFSITNSIDPMYQYKKGPLLKQPAAILVDSNSAKVYVLDTGNCRIRVLDTNLNYIFDVQNDCMRGRSSTGIALLSDQTLVTVNWRTNTVTHMTSSGETIKSWTHSDMIEPVCIAVDQIYDHILIGDSSCNIYVFKAKTGQHLFTINNTQNNGKSVECIGTFMAIGHESEIIVINRVSDVGYRCLNIYSSDGTYKRSIKIITTDKSSQPYTSLATCRNFILASRRHYNSYVIDLIDMTTGQLINTVDSNACKLRRPAGMVAFTEAQDSEAVIDEKQMSPYLSYYLLVTDVSADSINKYQIY